MRKSIKGCIAVILFLCAIILIIIGLVLTTKQTLYNNLLENIRSEKKLRDDSIGYKIWSSPKELTFAINLFHVENPNEILLGELPRLIERGPYFYDIKLEREILSVNEIRDEITFNFKKTYYFNDEKSGELSEHDEVLVINMAYLGAINTVAGFSVTLLRQFGEALEKLFPEENPLFVRAKVKDLIFDGIPLFCDISKHEQMKLICLTLKGRKPPILWNTDIENHYMYSVLGTTNGTWYGPITTIRGVKDQTLLGGITSMKNKRQQKYWGSEECNRISGQDGLLFPYYDTPPKRINIYVYELCRPFFIEYQKDTKVGMFDAWHYINPPEVWTRNETDCYCPVIKKKMNCPPIGLLDANKCTKIPVFISEPHFYNGDPTLLDYVPDLNPNQKLHSSFLLLDSFTSTPLEACRKSQINMKIIQQPIDLLANVTEGYFPILWSNEAAKMDPTNLEMIKMTYQLRRFVLILQWLPAAIGVFLLLLILMCYKLPIPRKKLQSIDTVTTINPNFVSSNIQGLEEHLPRGRNPRLMNDK